MGCGPRYPYAPPTISVQPIQNVTELQVEALLVALREFSEESLGQVMAFGLVSRLIECMDRIREEEGEQTGALERQAPEAGDGAQSHKPTSSPVQRASVLFLPDPAIRIIFSCLKFYEVWRCRQQCSRWYYISQDLGKFFFARDWGVAAARREAPGAHDWIERYVACAIEQSGGRLYACWEMGSRPQELPSDPNSYFYDRTYYYKLHRWGDNAQRLWTPSRLTCHGHFHVTLHTTAVSRNVAWRQTFHDHAFVGTCCRGMEHRRQTHCWQRSRVSEDGSHLRRTWHDKEFIFCDLGHSFLEECKDMFAAKLRALGGAFHCPTPPPQWAPASDLLGLLDDGGCDRWECAAPTEQAAVPLPPGRGAAPPAVSLPQQQAAQQFWVKAKRLETYLKTCADKPSATVFNTALFRTKHKRWPGLCGTVVATSQTAVWITDGNKVGVVELPQGHRLYGGIRIADFLGFSPNDQWVYRFDNATAAVGIKFWAAWSV
uniref:RWD domain-containing protein n=1 Tax=Eutreptiella gymnastica TaxID=73025 RepID=A0A7S4CUS2_9EUGL